MTDLNLIKKCHVFDNFINRYIKLVKDIVIPYQEKALNDQIEGAEKSHCLENFRMAAEKIKTGKCCGEFYGMVFQDSDVAKWLEGAAYSLLIYPDDELLARCENVIELIAGAQHDDGYLNTYFTVKEPDKRWTNLEEAHELYCAGHMIEGAVAFYECTKNEKIINVACKIADNIYQHFISDGAEGFSGHPEIELALLCLYRCTGNDKYKELSLHFIDVRGVDSDYFIRESEKNNWTVWGNNPHDKEYTQCHMPVREQTKATGHAVRAVYLYTAMADAAKETGDESLKIACKNLWENITQCRMYVTGGIGSAYEGEAFTADYHLPNNTAYAETCAAIGLIFFARRMLALEKNGKYADVMERALYNCVLAGMELDGTKFFYVNPLEVIPDISGAVKTHHHTLPQRPKWFACACCPPNVARLLPSIAEYAWSLENNSVYSNLFIGSTLELDNGTISLSTNYPYAGNLKYSFAPNADCMKITLAIRMPDWSANTKILLNGSEVNCKIVTGYAYIDGEFTAEDIVTVELDMSVKHVYASSNVSDNSGKTALSRGPLVYCAEGVDNDGDVLSLSLKKNGSVTVSDFLADKLCGICELRADGYRTISEKTLYSFNEPKKEPYTITLIPYYSWANRGLTQMRVWIPESE